jgi:hypothetical protein
MNELKNPRDEANELLSAAIRMAKLLINDFGSHFPFGMAITVDGTREDIAADDRSVRDPEQLAQGVLSHLKEHCVDGSFRAVAFARNVTYHKRDDPQPVDAIEVTLDHVADSAVTCVLPYWRTESGMLEEGQLFAVDPRYMFFSGSST